MNQCRAEPGFSENGRLLLEAEEAGGRTKLSRSLLSAHKRLSNDDQAKKKKWDGQRFSQKLEVWCKTQRASFAALS
jgi:hypothetical protein